MPFQGLGTRALGLLVLLLLPQPRLPYAQAGWEGRWGGAALRAPSSRPAGGGRRDPAASPQALAHPAAMALQIPSAPTTGPAAPTPPAPTAGPAAPTPPAPTARPAAPTLPAPTTGSAAPTPPAPTAGPAAPTPPAPTAGSAAPTPPAPTAGPAAPTPPAPTAGPAAPTPPAPPAPTQHLPSSCGRQTTRVVGGQPAAEGRWPWQVSLRVLDQHMCGGSLIANRWVMTAAHCIYGYMDYILKVGGIHVNPSSKNSIKVPVLDIVIHQDFKLLNALENDIALILLQFPVNYSDYIQPVCFPEKRFMVPTDTDCWVTGWGKLKEKDPREAAPKLLQEADLKIIRREKCNEIFKKQMDIRFDMVRKGCVCAYSELGKDSCPGDSGGPLVCEFNNTWVQVGIVSWGIGCGRKGYPGVYTEVSVYRDWVIDQMNLASSHNSAGLSALPLCLVLPLGVLVTL